MPMKEKGMISTSDPRVCMIGHPAPAWLVNYADLMTELVCFFIVLYALSAALNKDVQKAKKDVEEKMKQDKVAGQVSVDKDGMKITIEEKGENVFFESGSSELSPRMIEILGTITPSLKELAKAGHDIIVEGHTDDIPINTARFSSNWELSTARATSVVEYMTSELKFPPNHMGAIGYGQYRPLVANDTDDHRATNRRVVFFVKNKSGNFGDDKKKDGDKSKTAGGTLGDADAQAPPATEPAADGADGQASSKAEPTTDTAIPLPTQAPNDSAGQ